MKIQSILGLSAVALALTLGGREAAADHVFKLVDVMFDDGGTMTGTFTTDDAITSLLNFDITTSSEAGFPAFEYTPASIDQVNNNLPDKIQMFSGLARALSIGFTGGLAATGATPIDHVASVEINNTSIRDVVSGSAVAVPEPSTLVLGGIAALAGLWLWPWLLWARRRRAASRAG